MKKRDFKTYQKLLRDFEILPKFSKTHIFRGTIRHPYLWKKKQLGDTHVREAIKICKFLQAILLIEWRG